MEYRICMCDILGNAAFDCITLWTTFYDNILKIMWLAVADGGATSN